MLAELLLMLSLTNLPWKDIWGHVGQRHSLSRDCCPELPLVLLIASSVFFCFISVISRCASRDYLCFVFKTELFFPYFILILSWLFPFHAEELFHSTYHLSLTFLFSAPSHPTIAVSCHYVLLFLQLIGGIWAMKIKDFDSVSNSVQFW